VKLACASWADHRFALGTARVEDLLAERGMTVSRESVRTWVNRIGPHFADGIKRDRPAAADKWHLDERVAWMGATGRGGSVDLTTRQRDAF
jgi:putative transposase